MQLLIPTAKIVSGELQNIGKLPAVIYPLNDKIVFDYLNDQYRDSVDSIDILCYENADKIHRRLLGYDDSKIHIIELDMLKDLGHTIYFGLHDFHESVIINFGDTIVFEDIQRFGEDCFFYSQDIRTETWTFFRMKQGMITTIYDKIPDDESSIEDLFVGVFKLSDAKLFKECLEQAFKNIEPDLSTFYYALKMYSSLRPLHAVYTNRWLDIGHADKYNASKMMVKARDFNHISIDKERGILRKSSDNLDKFIGEIKWYLKLPADIEYVRPRIFDYSTEYCSPYISMEYYAYHTVHDLFLYGDLSRKQWMDIFSRIHFVYTDFKRYRVKDDAIKTSLKDMYLYKTKARLDMLKKDSKFINFFNKNVLINGNEFLPLKKIVDILEEEIPKQLFDIDCFQIIHGDLCFSNIMVDDNFSFIKLIDPRGKFGEFDLYGDYRYEIAKLLHSVDGKYDFIIKDLFKVKYISERNQIDFKILDRVRKYDLCDIFINVFFNEIDGKLKKIELIEALLFLTMIPLHCENFNHQLVMLGTGLEILNRNINITYIEGD